MRCTACGVDMQIGDWPWCPHGTPSYRAFDDQLPHGPYWCETLGHEPVFVTSKSHLKREADMRGLECVGGRRSADYYARHRRLHDQELRELGKNVEY